MLSTKKEEVRRRRMKIRRRNCEGQVRVRGLGRERVRSEARGEHLQKRREPRKPVKNK